jgi:hypothetical protein
MSRRAKHSRLQGHYSGAARNVSICRDSGRRVPRSRLFSSLGADPELEVNKSMPAGSREALSQR